MQDTRTPQDPTIFMGRQAHGVEVDRDLAQALEALATCLTHPHRAGFLMVKDFHLVLPVVLHPGATHLFHLGPVVRLDPIPRISEGLLALAQRSHSRPQYPSSPRLHLPLRRLQPPLSRKLPFNLHASQRMPPLPQSHQSLR